MSRIRLLLVALLIVGLAGCTTLDALSGEVTAESQETQSVIVPGVPTLVVDHFAGNVTIRDGEANRITANLTRQSRLDNAAEAEAQLELITMTFTQTGTDVTLSIKGRDDVSHCLLYTSRCV